MFIEAKSKMTRKMKPNIRFSFTIATLQQHATMSRELK